VSRRERLPNRRGGTTWDFEWQGLTYTITSNGHLEVFVHSSKNTSAYEAIARDAAIVVSIAFQYGVPLEVLRAGVTRDDEGEPASLMGKVLDELIVQQVADGSVFQPEFEVGVDQLSLQL
jgi:hypothetical protein